MTEKFKILSKYIKDLSSETPDVETYLFVRDNISSYQLGIDITSKAIKNKLIEINTTLKFEDKSQNKKKSYFEIVYATVIKVDDDVKDKKELQKIILCDAQIAIYDDLNRSQSNDEIFRIKGLEKNKTWKKIAEKGDDLIDNISENPSENINDILQALSEENNFIEGEFEDIEAEENAKKI